jgi:hypothetical protein
MQVPPAVAFNEVPTFNEQPEPETVKVTVPFPDPPDVVSAIFVPTVPVSGVFDTVSVAWATVAAVKVKVVATLVASKYPGDPAFVAVTTHVPAAVAFKDVPLTEHPVPVTVKVTAPSPDPPDVVSAMFVPIVPVCFVFDTVSVAWATRGVTCDDALDVEVTVAEGVVLAVAVALGVEVTVAEAVVLAVTDADESAPRSPRMTGAPAFAVVPPEPPHPARSITAHAMTAPAAVPLPERETNAPKRLLRALIEGLASPGLSPIIVHVPSGY